MINNISVGSIRWHPINQMVIFVRAKLSRRDEIAAWSQ